MTQKEFNDFKDSCKTWIRNCSETRSDFDKEKVKKKNFREKLQLDHLKIESDWTHRTGKPLSPSGKTPPIVEKSVLYLFCIQICQTISPY